MTAHDWLRSLYVHRATAHYEAGWTLEEAKAEALEAVRYFQKAFEEGVLIYCGKCKPPKPPEVYRVRPPDRQERPVLGVPDREQGGQRERLF